MQQSRSIGRPNPTSQARLQLLLLALAAWNIITFLLALTNAPLVSVGDIDGILGARAVNGASAVLALAYLWAARNPLRYRFVIWMAAVDQVVGIFSAGFHWTRGDLGASEAIVPIAVATGILALLAANLPRQTDTL